MIEGIFVHKKFIEEELSIAPSAYISIYLMTIAFPNANSQEIAELLNMLESDVIKSWDYWCERNILNKKNTDTSSNNHLNQNSNISKDLDNNKSNKLSSNSKKPVILSEKPVYTIEELNEYMNNDEMATFIQNIHTKLGRPLKDSEISHFLGFHTFYGLPFDVIDVLIDYVIKEGKNNINYMEKVAITWADANIQTVEQAINFATFRNSNHKAVMTAFGKGHEPPLDNQANMIKIWTEEYKMPIDLITLACQRTIHQIEKVSFNYANGIIKKWYENNVKTLEDVEKSDQVFKCKQEADEKIKETNTSKNNINNRGNVKVSSNNFSNFEQRKWDFEEIKRRQRDKRDKF